MKELTPAELVQAILDGKKVEFRMMSSDTWFELKEWKSVKLGELLDAVWQYRLVQEMVTIGGVNFPKPVSEPLALGTKYWVAEPSYLNHTMGDSYTWCADADDRLFLKRGLIHLSKENAIEHSKALIKLSGGNPDD